MRNSTIVAQNFVKCLSCQLPTIYSLWCKRIGMVHLLDLPG